MQTSYPQRYFDELYTHNQGDPWCYGQRWYEIRKRQISLAVLPKPKFKSIFEVGCSTGVMSAQLAQRSDAIYCLDAHPTALAQAQQNLAAYSHVCLKQGIIPQDLPQQSFDLIVISEVLYYLNASDLTKVMAWLNQQLVNGACLLACHWRKRIDDFEFDGDQIHQQLKQHLMARHELGLQDHDFNLDLWWADTKSVAQHEGLR